MDLGQDRRGVDMGPSAIRYARLQGALEATPEEIVEAATAIRRDATLPGPLAGAVEFLLLMSRKHPQRTPPPRRWWQRLNRHCAQTPGAGSAAEHTVGRVRRLRRRCGHSALRLAVLPEPRISVVHQPHWFPQQKVPNGRRR